MMPPSAGSRTGPAAERLARTYLERQGLEVLHSNWRCRFGEIDLVCRDRDTIVFVEVRLRTNPRFGSAGDSIQRAKRGRLIAAARLYLSRGPERPCRFDAVLLDRLEADRLEWIRDAFSDD
jgi:putative endonuclease